MEHRIVAAAADVGLWPDRTVLFERVDFDDLDLLCLVDGELRVETADVSEPVPKPYAPGDVLVVVRESPHIAADLVSVSELTRRCVTDVRVVQGREIDVDALDDDVEPKAWYWWIKLEGVT